MGDKVVTRSDLIAAISIAAIKSLRVTMALWSFTATYLRQFLCVMVKLYYNYNYNIVGQM